MTVYLLRSSVCFISCVGRNETVACSRTAAEVGSLFPSCHLAVAVAARQRLTRTACIKSLLCDFLGTILASYRSVLTDGEPARRRHSAWSESTRATP